MQEIKTTHTRASPVMRITLSTLLCFFSFVGPASSQQTDSSFLTVRRIYGSSEFKSQSFGPARWLGDGSSYTTLEQTENGQNLVRYDTETGAREVLLVARQFIPQGDSVPLQVEEYAWAPDHRALLIFSNTRPVWRLNTRGDYWVLERANGKLRKLGGPSAKPSTLMFAKFSPDGRRIAFWQLNADSVKDFNLINYTDSLYSRVMPIQYPKAGESNSAARVG